MGIGFEPQFFESSSLLKILLLPSYILGVNPPGRTDHQDSFIFSTGLLLAFTFHCYWEGIHPMYDVCKYTHIYNYIYISKHHIGLSMIFSQLFVSLSSASPWIWSSWKCWCLLVPGLCDQTAMLVVLVTLLVM